MKQHASENVLQPGVQLAEFVVYHNWLKLNLSQSINGQFQDPKMEVLYHIRSYFVGRSPSIDLTLALDMYPF